MDILWKQLKASAPAIKTTKQARSLYIFFQDYCDWTQEELDLYVKSVREFSRLGASDDAPANKSRSFGKVQKRKRDASPLPVKHNHSNKTRSKKHFRISLPEYKCKLCPIRLMSKKGYDAHQQEHAARAKRFNCPSCEVQFGNAAKMIRHRKLGCVGESNSAKRRKLSE